VKVLTYGKKPNQITKFKIRSKKVCEREKRARAASIFFHQINNEKDNMIKARFNLLRPPPTYTHDPRLFLPAVSVDP